MGNLPYFYFYPGDWMKDPVLQTLSLAAQGLWLRMMCLMAEGSRRGFLEINGQPITTAQLARATGATVDEAHCLLKEMDESGFLKKDRRGILYCSHLVKQTELSHTRSRCGSLGGRPSKNAKKNKELIDLEKQNKSKTKAKVKQTLKQNESTHISSSFSCSVNTSPSGRMLLGNIGPPKRELKTQPRLQVFLEAYKRRFGRDYVISNFAEAGGAARTTVTKVDDQTYEKAIEAYFASNEKRIVESGFPFSWFIRDLNIWVTKSGPKPEPQSFVEAAMKFLPPELREEVPHDLEQ